MSISFGGLGSGLPVQDLINAQLQIEGARLLKFQQKQRDTQYAKTHLNTVESKFNSLRSALEKLTDAKLASSFDIFAKKQATSSDDGFATASALSNAVAQKIDLKIESLATSTTAKSLVNIGQNIDGSETFTDLSNEEAKEGTFGFYVDGIKHEFTIEESDTLNDIIADINGAGIAGVQASITDGKFEFKVDNAEVTEFVMGSNADTSNFFNVMNLSAAKSEALTGEDPYDTAYKSTVAISKIDLDAKILDGSANLTGTFSEASYTFKIGGAEFTVDDTTSLDDLIGQINGSDDAGVTISYDSRQNKLVVSSEDAGKNAINFEDTSGDFLKQLGFIAADGNALSSQTLGENAKVFLNGSAEALEVNSNTLSSDISGIAGVTINLKNITKTDETISIDVAQDTEELTTAVEGFIEKFNAVISEVDKETSKGEYLHGEYSLVSIRNTIRGMATGAVDGLSSYNNFSMIGITTGEVGTGVEQETNALKLDKDAFLEAFQKNPSEVKALLIGDSNAGVSGIIEQLEEKIEGALDPINGYFAAREDSMSDTLEGLDKSILREQDKLEKREQYLKNMYSRMDQYISQLQSQQSALASFR